MQYEHEILTGPAPGYAWSSQAPITLLNERPLCGWELVHKDGQSLIFRRPLA